MKILHIIPAYLPAKYSLGPLIPTHTLNKSLAENGHEVTVYTTNIDGPETLNVPLYRSVMKDGVKVFYFPSTFRPWKYSKSMHRAIKRSINKFDVVHITSTFLAASTIGSYYARKNNVPHVMTLHGALMEAALSSKPLKKKFYLNLIEKRNISKADGVHFTTLKEKKEFKEGGFEFKKSKVIPNSLNVSELNHEPRKGLFKEKFNINKNSDIILFLGRLSWEKGFDTLIPSFKRLSEENPDAVLVLAGTDEDGYKDTIMNEIEKYGLKDKVIFTGFIDKELKVAALRESSLMVLPSYSENFGMSVAEALYMKLPVVITNKVGISSFIEKEDAGVVVSKNTSELYRGMKFVIENKEKRKKFKKNGLKVIEKMKPSSVADQWEDFYKSLT